jgi:hypothetical protein
VGALACVSPVTSGESYEYKPRAVPMMFASVTESPREMPVPYGATQITADADVQEVVEQTVLWMRVDGVKSSDPKFDPSIVTWPPAVFGPL